MGQWEWAPLHRKDSPSLRQLLRQHASSICCLLVLLLPPFSLAEFFYLSFLYSFASISSFSIFLYNASWGLKALSFAKSPFPAAVSAN